MSGRSLIVAVDGRAACQWDYPKLMHYCCLYFHRDNTQGTARFVHGDFVVDPNMRPFPWMWPGLVTENLGQIIDYNIVF
eukprot:2976950-Amphidinium_carterae.1